MVQTQTDLRIEKQQLESAKRIILETYELETIKLKRYKQQIRIRHILRMKINDLNASILKFESQGRIEQSEECKVQKRDYQKQLNTIGDQISEHLKTMS